MSDQGQHLSRRTISGYDEGPPRCWSIEDEKKVVVGHIGIGWNRHAAPPSEMIPRPHWPITATQCNRMVLEHSLLAIQLDINRRGRLADFKPQWQRQLRAAFLPRHDHRHQQFDFAVVNVRPGRSHAHGHIAWIRLRIGKQLKANLLRQFGKCLPHPGPLAALRIPVVLPLIGAKPDFGGANRVFSHVIVGRLKQEGHVGWRGHRCRQIRKDFRALHFKGLLLRIGQNHQSAGGQCGKRLDQLPATSIEFGIRILSSGILLLHARGAIQNHNRCIGASTASQRQPPTRKRPTGRQEDGGHSQHPQHHDEPVTQPRIPSRERFG